MSTYTHLVECPDGLWLAYSADGRWIGRPCKRTSKGYAPKARYRYDILASHALAVTPLV